MRGCIVEQFLGFEFWGIGMTRASCGTAAASESRMDHDLVARKVAWDAACGNVGADRQTNVTASHDECNARVSMVRLKELELDRARRKWEGTVSWPSRTTWFREAAAST